MKYLFTISMLFALTFSFSVCAEETNSGDQTGLNTNLTIKSTADGEVDTECPWNKNDLSRKESAEMKPSFQDASRKPIEAGKVLEVQNNQ